MTVVRTGAVVHVDHVDRETLQFVIRLEHATISNTAGLVLAHPALLDALATTLFEPTVSCAVRAMLGIQPVLKLLVQLSARELIRKRADLIVKFGYRHKLAPRTRIRGLLIKPV
jgi:hypothetical protein